MFYVPPAGFTTQAQINQEMNMKTGSEFVSKSKGNGKGNGAAKQARQSDQLDSLSGANDCPLEQMIAEAAYFRAEQRGFTPGNEMSDWLQAEADMEGSMSHGRQ